MPAREGWMPMAERGPTQGIHEEIRDRLSIVVPTYNRYPFLRRLLTYYRACGSPFLMYILDSSSDPLEDPGLEELIRSPCVIYVKYDPNTMPTPKLCDGVHRVTTPYVVLWADDDLMVPRWFERGVRFLEEHPEVSIVYGQSGLFQVATSEDHTVISSLGPYWQRSYTDEGASQRLLHYLGHYAVLFYAVHHTRDLQHNLNQCRLYGLGYPHPGQAIERGDSWVEIVLGCLSIIQGQARQLPGLYMMRDRHPGVDSWEPPSGRLDVFGWVTCASFSRMYDAWSRCLSEMLVKQDRISLDEAEEAVRRAFCSYLARTLTKKLRGHDRRSGVTSRLIALREAARDIPALRSAWRAARSLVPGSERAMSLDALLRPSSPYHADFMPMYRVIIGADSDGVLQGAKGAGGARELTHVP